MTHGPNSSHGIKETPVMGNVLPKERPRNFSEAMLEGELQETGCNRMDVMQQKLVYLVATLKAFICHYETL